MERNARLLGLIALFIGLAGCSDYTTGEVSGRVSLDGEPVPKGAIMFMPADGKSPTSGGLIADGKYSAKVAVGSMKVSISVPKIVGKKKIYNTPNSPEMPITKEALPARYNENTELTLEVKPGKNEHNYDLKSK